MVFSNLFERNAHSLFIPIIKRNFDIKIKSYETLPSEMLWSMTSSADFLCRIVTEDNVENILHVEFQMSDNHETMSKVFTYQRMIYAKYQLPIYHVLFFLGEGYPPLRIQPREREFYHSFNLLNVNELDTIELINSQESEDILLAMLSNREEELNDDIMSRITQKISDDDETEQFGIHFMVASSL